MKEVRVERWSAVVSGGQCKCANCEIRSAAPQVASSNVDRSLFASWAMIYHQRGYAERRVKG